MDADNPIVAELKARLGDKYVRTGSDAEGHLEDFWGRARGKALCVALPGNTEEVAAVLKICQRHQLAVFPQGGNTSTCLGAVPDAKGQSIVLALGRMNRILALQPEDFSLVAEAGCVLADIQQAASQAGLLFPLSLGAEGSCQIGGNVATNAGGTAVLRYGNTRDLVLGIEAVLPDGQVWNGLRTLRKDNTGYDLKHLFIGGEGTLGVITKVALKLFPQPPQTTTVLIAFDDIAHLAGFTQPLRRAFDTAIGAMELISGSEVRIVKAIYPDLNVPYDPATPWFLLVDIACEQQDEVNERLQQVLGDALENGHVSDVLVAHSEAHRAAIWRLRHTVTEAHKKYGMGMSHDVAIPLMHIAGFIQQAGAIVASRFPQAEIALVGHVGDGNLHYNVMFEQRVWEAIEDQAATRKAVYRAIYDLAAKLDGTFSAEHGIGALHVAEMAQYKPPVELQLMRGIKALLDPDNRMNPGRVLPG
ncbi:FAD-binding oxidoreductase [Pseudomonas sp. S31]|uniref:FAD-binding oxidoreductase n=1 Tax=Pseudomonas sp. S31 TaxID=1564473 RepID=UPI001913DD34|nr:FAD-binding oxidoreductase [Pseudomonas sp. S31]MBK5000218.1 FAD-binding oxidoreductase [Pseudomonas sp. S31]